MAKNLVNYDQVSEGIRRIEQLTENLIDAAKIGINETKALKERSNAVFLDTVADIGTQLLNADTDCLDGIQDVKRAFARYEEEHRGLAEKL